MDERAKIAVITGASNGIGKRLADKLYTSGGYKIVNIDTDESGFDRRFLNFNMDVKEFAWSKNYRSIDSKLIESYGHSDISILVNNAGVNYINHFLEITEDDYDRVMDVNVKGTFFVTQKFFENIKRAKGTVLNIVSSAAYKPMRCTSVYNASKGAVEILTRQMARELSIHGVTIFGVAPNKILDTKMSEYVDTVVPVVREWTKEQAQKYELSNIPCGKNTTLDAFTDFLYYLLINKVNNEYLSGNVMEYGI